MKNLSRMSLFSSSNWLTVQIVFWEIYEDQKARKKKRTHFGNRFSNIKMRPFSVTVIFYLTLVFLKKFLYLYLTRMIFVMQPNSIIPAIVAPKIITLCSFINISLRKSKIQKLQSNRLGYPKLLLLYTFWHRVMQLDIRSS